MITEILLGIVILLLFILILLFWRSQKARQKEIEVVISDTWIRLGLDKKIGAVESYIEDVRNSYRSFEQMLKIPTERACFGEMGLEVILGDQLPPGMYGVREKILDGKIPDAYIKSTVGIICIDSKFPLDNYIKMLDSKIPKEKEDFKRQFLKDVGGHLNKIAGDYISPEKGTSEFAFAYIPSESVYYFLVNEAFEMLRNYIKRGVQVISPLTLSHKIELIKAGVHAKKLSEDAEKVRNDLLNLSQKFSDIDRVWLVFYRTHLKNLEGKAEELDSAYRRLREEFDRISKASEEVK